MDMLVKEPDEIKDKLVEMRIEKEQKMLRRIFIGLLFAFTGAFIGWILIQ